MRTMQDNDKAKEQHKDQHRGFTLPEVLLVMALLLLVALAAMPILSGSVGTARLKLTAEELANEVRLAQTMARSHGRNTRLTFFQDGRVILAFEDTPHAPIKAVYSLPSGTTHRHAGDPHISFSSQGGVFYRGSAGNAAWRLTLEDINVKDSYYQVVIAVNSGRVRTELVAR